MTLANVRIGAVLFVLTTLPSTLLAHRQWLLPSSTVLSNAGAWVTVDAAVSNELFYFDHVPLRLSNLKITGPDGGEAKPENAATGKYRSTFDVHLSIPGTYRIATVSNMVMARWKENGEEKNWRGPAAEFTGKAPAGASELAISTMNSRVETFVTVGKPSNRACEPTGKGLELVPVTHPNDLIAGKAATFQFLLDGKPAAGLEVTLIPGGIRYRDQPHEIRAQTGSDGRFTTTFKEPGMYWLNAATAPARPAGPGAAPVGPSGPPRMPVGDRSSYTATLEVLPE